jgi:hypothetical protein
MFVYSSDHPCIYFIIFFDQKVNPYYFWSKSKSKLQSEYFKSVDDSSTEENGNEEENDENKEIEAEYSPFEEAPEVSRRGPWFFYQMNHLS